MRLLLDECVPRPLEHDLTGHNVEHVVDQNLRGVGVGVVVVSAPTNRLKDLRPLVPRILEALSRATAGEHIRVGG